MSNSSMFEKDLLFPTENISEPGIIRIKILDPNIKSKIPVVIELKTNHSPQKYMETIIKVIQNDVFDRIQVDIKKHVSLYLEASAELKKDFENKKYVAVQYSDKGELELCGIDEPER